MLTSPSQLSTAETNSVLYRSNDISILCIVQESNQFVSGVARAVSTRPQLVLAASSSPILSQGKLHAKSH